MANHILIEVASRTRIRRKPEIPPDAHFDSVRGLWVRREAPWIHLEGSLSASKKNDMETGEDLKGE